MLGVYIHIPFCKNICNYCDFCKMNYNEKYTKNYLNNLKKEIHTRYKGEKIDTLYIGGGTPTSLTLEELEYLLEITNIFNKEDNIEFTIESNIEDMDINKINLLKSYGVNRISFGVESFNKESLNILGRTHTKEEIFDTIDLTKKYFSNINIDLIYGVTDNIDTLKEDIHNFLLLDIPHISCYSLILEKNTKLYNDKFTPISEDIDYEMYNYIKEELKKKGYNHYEISNYAKKGYESIHNKIYWLNESYYGFGLGAVSYINNYRISNTKNLSKYLEDNFIFENNYENEQTRKENGLILGLRLIDGINYLDYNKKYNTNILEKEIIKKLINDNKLEIIDNNIRIPSKYIYLSNTILSEIIGSDQL